MLPIYIYIYTQREADRQTDKQRCTQQAPAFTPTYNRYNCKLKQISTCSYTNMYLQDGTKCHEVLSFIYTYRFSHRHKKRRRHGKKKHIHTNKHTKIL